MCVYKCSECVNEGMPEACRMKALESLKCQESALEVQPIYHNFLFHDKRVLHDGKLSGRSARQ